LLKKGKTYNFREVIAEKEDKEKTVAKYEVEIR